MSEATSLLNVMAGNFWIVNQIIERGLHASDEEIKLYTTNLVDKLEQVGRESKQAAVQLCSLFKTLMKVWNNSLKARIRIMIQ